MSFERMLRCSLRESGEERTYSRKLRREARSSFVKFISAIMEVYVNGTLSSVTVAQRSKTVLGKGRQSGMETLLVHNSSERSINNSFSHHASIHPCTNIQPLTQYSFVGM